LAEGGVLASHSRRSLRPSSMRLSGRLSQVIFAIDDLLQLHIRQNL
jgi:hypothetical protein